ncbi:hypothetical protein ACS0TY_036459 [Phlomoides rotata]
MTTRSDFAQKLLGDLRLRKEKMAAGQNSSRQSSQTSRVTQGNSGQTSKSARRINALESAGSVTGNTSRRSNGSSRSVNIKESSNQIVLYESGQNSRQVRDLSMAIAFAFENNGNLSKISGTSSNPLVNFFNRFGRRSLNSQKMEITTFNSQSLPNGYVSNIHINEISKGVHKLNQILSACSNGHTFDRNSIEVGKQLLKGAMDLEESLRMLVNLQDGSQYANSSQKKSRLKLLDEDEDEDEDNDKNRKLDRPRFSFDKPSKRRQQPKSNSELVLHERSTSYIQDLSLTIQVNNNNSQSTKEKARISNVIAKLMGLEEIPLNDDSKCMKSDTKGKEGKVPRENTSKKSTITNTMTPVRESKLQVRPEKSKGTPDGASEKNQQRKDLKAAPVSKAAIVDQQSHPSADSRRKQSYREDKQNKVTDSESKMLVSNTEQQKKAQNSKKLKAAHTRLSSIEQEIGANSTEKWNADKDQQQKPQDQRRLLQEQVPKRAEHSEDKRRVEQKGQKQSNRSIATNGQKKLSHDKSAPGNGVSMRQTEKVPIKDPPNSRNQDTSIMIYVSQNTETDEVKNKNEDQSHNSEEVLLLTNEKPMEVQATQKRSVPRKVQRSEIPQKIDVLITRRNATVNHRERSIKKPANMLKDLKQQMHKKNSSSKRMEGQGDSKVKEGNIGISIHYVPEVTTETEKIKDKLLNEDEQTFQLSSTEADEWQLQNTHSLNDICKTIVLSPGEVLDDLKDEEEHKQSDQSIEIHKDSTERYKQYPTSKRREQLTEPEKHLKETLIKSHMFLSTAEALFKLNIPLSFLHAGDHGNETAETKLVLDCAYEVMKRKARRHEVAYNPYVRTTISSTKVQSLDNLVKQLCKDLEMLNFYGMNGRDECDVAAGLYRMLNRDIYNVIPDVNTMWDFEWSQIMSMFPQMEDVVKDVERHMLNGLLDDITNDFLSITVLA